MATKNKTVNPAAKKSAPNKNQKYVYTWGAGKADGDGGMKPLLGGKGANLAEMTRIKLPVPPGFTITTEVCTYFYANRRSYPAQLQSQMEAGVRNMEKIMGYKFGDAKGMPLLVAVRSGARDSMPGMMDTILNLGLNDQTVIALAAATKNPRFAWDCYRRFVQMYGDVVLGVQKLEGEEHEPFEVVIEEFKHEKYGQEIIDSELTADDQQAPDLRARALRLFQRCAENGGVFPGALAAFAPLAGHDLPDAKLTAAFEDFTRDGKNAKWVNDYNRELHGKDAAKRQLAAIVLVNLATGKVGRENERESAKKAVEKSFDKPESAAALLTAIARTDAKPLAELVKANLNHPNNTVAEAALFAFQKLGLNDPTAKQIGTMSYEEVFAAVQKGGDANAGKEMFLRAACIACHTINADEPPKGPVLSAVAKIYDRATLTESILKPNAKIAQGFESVFFKTKKGEQIEGFITREGGDSVDVRNIAGQVVTIEKGDITERGTRPQSIMPEGLLNAFAPAELANLLAWLESLKK